MREKARPGPISPAFVVAPTLRRARAAIKKGALRWRGTLEPQTLSGFLARPRSTPVLICPEGQDLARDVAFLREAVARILWRAPEEGLRAAIGGLRGEELEPLPQTARRRIGEPRSLALLLEGRVSGPRARRALDSDVRLWIVESSSSLRLNPRDRERLAKAGVTWLALEPARVAALIASPRLAKARRVWRGLLPSRTKVIVIEP